MSELTQDTARKLIAALGPANDAEHPKPQPLTFDAFRAANVARCLKWHPEGIESATVAEMVNAENIGRGEKLADELRGEIARLHGAVCQAVALLNRADFGRSAEVVKVHDILREVLVSHADECEDCHAKAGTVCADFDCPGRRAQAA